MIISGCENDGTRSLVVHTQPDQAKVFLNGKPAGTTPCTIQWNDAQPDDLWELHVVEIKKEGFHPERKEIRYRTGEAWLPERLLVKLTPGSHLATGEVPPDVPPPPSGAPGVPAGETDTNESLEESFAVKEEKPVPTAKEGPPAPQPDATQPNPPPANEHPAEVVSLNPSQGAITAAKKRTAPPDTPPTTPLAKTTKEENEEQVMKTSNAEGPPATSKGKKDSSPSAPPKANASEKGPGEPALAIWVPKGRRKASLSSPDISQSKVENPPRKAETKPEATKPMKPAPVAPDPRWNLLPLPKRQLAYELRLVRLADGRVLGQESLLRPFSERRKVVALLVRHLARHAPDDATIAVGTLANRRGSNVNRKVADDVTQSVIEAVKTSPGLRFTKLVNLRDVILDEIKLESPKVISDARIAHLFTGSDYVIVGGVALSLSLRSKEPAPLKEPLRPVTMHD